MFLCTPARDCSLENLQLDTLQRDIQEQSQRSAHVVSLHVGASNGNF